MYRLFRTNPPDFERQIKNQRTRCIYVRNQSRQLDFNYQRTHGQIQKLPQFPEVRRDLAFVINEEVSFDDIQRVIKGAVQQNIFKGSEVFDVYQGENIDKGFKSLAFRIKMQDENATLTDEVIEKQMNNVRAKLQKTYAEISFRE